MKSVTQPEPIQKYPDEPHPDDEYAWKKWWVAKFYRPNDTLLEGDIVFMHRCWLETKARGCIGTNEAPV